MKINKTKRNKFIAFVSSSLASVLVLSAVLGGCASSCRKVNPNPDNSRPVEDAVAAEITDGYEKGYSRAPQTAEYLGEVDEIVKPVEGIHDEHEDYGVKEYPHYGKNLTDYTVSEMMGIINESRALTPYPTWKSLNIYDAIDAEGYLLRNGERVKYTAVDVDQDESEDTGDHEGEGELPDYEEGSVSASTQYSGEYRMLYAHTASDTMYGGGLSDDEPRIIKKISFLTRAGAASNQITGLYAPAGEVIKVEISEEDLKAAGGALVVYIGQNYNLDQQVSMEWTGSGIKGSGLSRMSDILNKFVVTSPVSYVGSFLGGPIYVRPNSNRVSCNISVTISGGVKYQHFILGATTEEEYNLNKQSTAPYFDLEVYDQAVRFTCTKYASSGGLAFKDYTYENCTDGAILWDKISQVSKRVDQNGLTSTSVPVMIIGDCYIAAGAAFANPGRNGVVCPYDWLASALNYNDFVNSGSWGTMHEYNHCWQGYGFGNGGEVSNNATTLVSYSLYTRISAARTSAVNWGDGGWNRFTDPSQALTETLTLGRAGAKLFDLSGYATLLHNIGQDNYLAAAHGGRESGCTVYYNKLVSATQMDMTYFFTEVMNYDIGEAAGNGVLGIASVQEAQAKNYPMFVPVASVYQVGRSITYGNGEKQYIYTAQPFAYGSGEYVMDFSDRNDFKNGVVVNKGLVIPDGFTAEVTAVSQPANGMVSILEGNQVKYTPKSNSDELCSGEFKVRLSITKDDGEFEVDDVELIINLKQGNNLDRTTYVYDSAAAVPDTASIYNPKTKTFDFGDYSSTETKKNVCTQETNTQIWAAGRNYDDDTYNASSTNYRVMPLNQTLQTLDGVMYFTNAGTYRFTLKGRGVATLYLSYDKGATWEPSLTINRTSGNAYIDTEYAEHEFKEGKNLVYFKVVLLVTKESDFFGVGCSVKNADGEFTSFANASAYKNEALFNDATSKFITEYRYKMEYSYTFTNNATYNAAEQTLVSANRGSTAKANLPIENLFDGKTNTYYHSSETSADYISETNPFELVADLGTLRRVNNVTFYFYLHGLGNNGMPTSFKLYGSTDGVNFNKLLLDITDYSYASSKSQTFDFNETEIRYYKLVVTKTDNKYFAMASIVFNYIGVTYSGGHLIAPNETSIKYTGVWGYRNVLSNFGLIYTSSKGGYAEFTFTGTRFAYFAYQSAEFGTVDIYLDGKLIASDVDLSADNNASSVAYMYLESDLSAGEHVVKIVGKSGKFNVDAFAYWS